MFRILRYIFRRDLAARLRPVFWHIFLNRKSSPKAYIKKPVIFSVKDVIWKDDVCIMNNARIECIKKYNSINYNPSIFLHNGVSIQQNCHITCAEKIEIGDNTALASNVTVTDIDHPYLDISIPIEKQNLIVKAVKIGRDCKIYNNAVILQGSIIGNHCVIGANSVVKGEFPDNSVIVGCPARIVKQYNPNTRTWIPIKQGESIQDNKYEI